MASELHQAVLHGQAAAVQALLLRPLMVGTAEDLTRRQAARAEPAARLRAAERALTEATEAEKAALKARVAADDLYHAIQAEGADWAAQHEADKAKRARSPRDGPADEDVIVATGDAGSPRLLSPEELQSARRRKCRSAQTFTSEVAQRAVLPAPWEPLPEPQQLSDEDRAQAEARLSEKLAAGKASPLEAARLRQHHWVDGMAELRATRIGRILYDPDAIQSLYDLQNNPPWMRETKQLLAEWARAYLQAEIGEASSSGSGDWVGTRTVPVKVTKALFEALLEAGPKDSGCESWQSEVQWVIGMLADAAPTHGSPRVRARQRGAASARSAQQLRDIFEQVDRNGDGEISRAELILRLRKDPELAALLDLPSHVKDENREEFEAVFQSMDTDANDNVDCEEFVRHFSRGAKQISGFNAVFHRKPINLPRQARDEHRKSWIKEAFSVGGKRTGAGTAECSLDGILTEMLVLGRATVRAKNASFCGAIFTLKTISLPRQARDEQRQS
jgi:hypothetical protein